MTARERFFFALTGAVLIGVAAVPHVAVPTGRDTFRLPKELWLRTEGIVLAVLLVLGFVWGWLDRKLLAGEKRVFVLVACVAGWTGVATIFSTDRAASAWSLLYVVCAAVVFVATVIAAFRRSLLFADIALIAAVPNAILCVLGELQIWYPFLTQREVLESGDPSLHNYAGGLLGNPNDVGSFLVAPVLAALILCATVPRRRLWYTVLAIILGAGLLAAQSAAAIGALFIALIVIAFRVSRKLALVIILFIALFAGLLATYSLGTQRKIRRTIAVLRADEVTAYRVDAAMSHRLLPFLVAWRMGLDHPLMGVGPGRFSWHVYPYKLAVENRYPTLRKSEMRPSSWAQVHNDHLQTLATTGLPGYALFLASIVMLARRSRRAPADGDEFAQTVRRMALPLAITFFVLTLAQFPMELGAATVMWLHWAALCVAWSSDATA